MINANVSPIPSGKSVKHHTPRKAIREISASGGEVDWRQIVVQVNHPTPLLNVPGASGSFSTPPILPAIMQKKGADETTRFVEE